VRAIERYVIHPVERYRVCVEMYTMLQLLAINNFTQLNFVAIICPYSRTFLLLITCVIIHVH